MKVITHLSDPHFGTESPAALAALRDDLHGRTAPRPSLVVISGDLTQRAKPGQYRAARAFLDALPVPYVVVPGNHDVPLYNVFARFFTPLARYREHITDDLMPVYADDELAVVGVNTAHGFTIKDGKINEATARAVAARFAAHPDRFKILVAHHPFVVPASRPAKERVDGADAALPILRDAGVELICTGHLHIAFATDAAGFRDDRREIIAAHAGTCISTRTRGEPNGYNLMTLDGDLLTLQQRVFDGTRFTDGPHKTYRRRDGHWFHADGVTARAPATSPAAA